MLVTVVNYPTPEVRNENCDEGLREFLSHVALLSTILLRLPVTKDFPADYVETIQRLTKLGNFQAEGFSIDDDELVTRFLDEGLTVAYFNFTDEDTLLQSVMKSFPRPRVGIKLHESLNVDQFTTLVNKYSDFAGHFILKCTGYDPAYLKAAKNLISASGFSIQVTFELPSGTTESIMTTVGTYTDGLHAALPFKIQSESPAKLLRNTYNEAAEEVDLVSAFISCLRSDRQDKLYTTVVCDEHGVCLGLVYSNSESIRTAILEKRGAYWSRSRSSLWRKGDSSGMFQELLQVKVDCDYDALRFTVVQRGDPPAFCHLMTRTCWGHVNGIKKLETILFDRKKSSPEGSYTKRLFDNPELLRKKLLEEVQELVEAEEPDHIAAEAADVLYFTLTRCVAAGVGLREIEQHLDSRTFKVTRRPGNAKDWRTQAAEQILASAASPKVVPEASSTLTDTTAVAAKGVNESKEVP